MVVLFSMSYRTITLSPCLLLLDFITLYYNRKQNMSALALGNPRDNNNDHMLIGHY